MIRLLRKLFARQPYAAISRCPCGAGMAHWTDEGVGGSWDCSKIPLGTADKNVQHTARLPFRFYEIKPDT